MNKNYLSIIFILSVLFSPLLTDAQVGVRQEDAPKNIENGDVTVRFLDFYIESLSIEKNSFNAGDIVNGVIKLKNQGDVHENALRYTLTLGTDFDTEGRPLNDYGFEEYIDLSLLPNSEKEIPFAFELPGTIQSEDASVILRIYDLSGTLLTFKMSPHFVITGGQQPIMIENNGFVFEENYSPETVVFADSGPVIHRDGEHTKAFMIARLANRSDKEVILTPYIQTSDFIKGDSLISTKETEPIIIPANGTFVHLLPVELFDYKQGVYVNRVVYRESGEDRTPVLYYKYVIAGESLVSIDDVSVNTEGPVYAESVLSTTILYTSGVYDFLAAGDDGTNENGIVEDAFVGVGEDVSVKVEFFNADYDFVGSAENRFVSKEEGSVVLDVPITIDTDTIKAVVTFKDNEGGILDTYETILFEGEGETEAEVNYLEQYKDLFTIIGLAILLIVVLTIFGINAKRRNATVMMFLLIFGIGFFLNSNSVDAGVGVLVAGVPESIGTNTNFDITVSASASVCKNRSGWASYGVENFHVGGASSDVAFSTGYSKFFSEANCHGNDGQCGTAHWSNASTVTFGSGPTVGTRTVHGFASLKKHNNDGNVTSYEYANAYQNYEVINPDMCDNLAGDQTEIPYPYTDPEADGTCTVPLEVSCQIVGAENEQPLNHNPAIGEPFRWKAFPASSATVPLIYTWSGDATNRVSGIQRYADGLFNLAGAYNATISVTQDIEGGQTDVAQCPVVTVEDRLEVICKVSRNSVLAVGQSIDVTATTYNATGNVIYEWGGVAVGSSATADFTVDNPGSYSATIRVTDGASRVANATCNIVVGNTGDLCPNIVGIQASVPVGYTTNGNGDCVPVVGDDFCPNIPDPQASIPEGMYVNSNGDCVPVVDYCPNIAGNQASIPDGYVVNSNGDCVPVDDICPNLYDIQTVVPVGYVINIAGECVPGIGLDICENIAGDQTTVPAGLYVDENGDCVPDPGNDDVCRNLPGIQLVVPDKYIKSGNYCLPVVSPGDRCPNIPDPQATIPAGYYFDYIVGECKVINDPNDRCPNIAGDQATVPVGYYLDENNNCSLITNNPPPSGFDNEEVTEF